MEKKETSNLVPVHREILKSKLWLILRISTSLVLKNYDFDWIRTLGSKPDRYQSENFDKIMKLSRYRPNTKLVSDNPIVRGRPSLPKIVWGTFSVRLFRCLGLNSRPRFSDLVPPMSQICCGPFVPKFSYLRRSVPVMFWLQSEDLRWLTVWDKKSPRTIRTVPPSPDIQDPIRTLGSLMMRASSQNYFFSKLVSG